MRLRIETLLQVVSDYQKFCAPAQPSGISVSPHREELSEHELDLIAAATHHPTLQSKDAYSKKHSQ